MPRIPDNEIERLKNEVSVERPGGASVVDLKMAGKDKLGRCPFHDDAEAALVVTPEKNLWGISEKNLGNSGRTKVRDPGDTASQTRMTNSSLP